MSKHWHVRENGTYEVWFWCPQSPNAEIVSGQRAIRLKAALMHYRSNLIDYLTEFSNSGYIPYGRYFKPLSFEGNKFLGLVINAIDDNPYRVDRLTARKIAYTVSELGVNEVIGLLDNCRRAVYQPIYLDDYGYSIRQELTYNEAFE